ncbi:MAG TPA: sugar ABC transporter substrate-binding protein [Firmicutes bacterium]|nr:sugar ABC transporter substrate-binding protein [Bacillota bacterium]
MSRRLKTLIVAFVLGVFLFTMVGSEFMAGAEIMGMLSKQELQKMVSEAMKVRPPRNGKSYVFGFANLQRDIPFCIDVENSIKKNCEAAGIDLIVADNRLDGATALANADNFVTRNVDFVIEFQTDVNFGPMIMERFNKAKIPVIAIDIPMPGAVFFGVNNHLDGYLAGKALAEAALKKWGDKAPKGVLVLGELPQSGEIPARRIQGVVDGFREILKGFPEKQIIRFDSKNTLDYSRQQMVDILARIPQGTPIMGTGINDEVAMGIVAALDFARRKSDALIVALGADPLGREGIRNGSLIGATAHFPDRYGNKVIPTALKMLAGEKVPREVFVDHVFITRDNVKVYYPGE